VGENPIFKRGANGVVVGAPKCVRPAAESGGENKRRGGRKKRKGAKKRKKQTIQKKLQERSGSCGQGEKRGAAKKGEKRAG